MAGRSADAPGRARWPIARRAAFYLAPLLALLGVLVALLYAQELRYERDLHRVQGRHVRDLQVAAIERAFTTVQSDLMFLRGQDRLAELLTHGTGRAQLGREYALFAAERRVYHQVRLLDEKGDEAVRVNQDAGRTELVDAQHLQSKGERYYFREAWRLEPGQTFVSSFDLNVEHGDIESPRRPVIRFATPVADRAGRKRGVLVLNYLGSELLAQLEGFAAQWPGRALLVDGAGYYLAGVEPARAWGFMFSRPADRFGVDHPRAWQRLEAEPSGQFSDAEGVFTFARVEPVTSSGPLRVVSFIPTAQAGSQAARSLRLLLSVAAIVALVFAVLAVFIARAHAAHRAHERHIAESEQRLRVLSARLLDTQERERRAIARNLHDDLGQLLTTVTLHLQRAGQADVAERKDAAIEQAAEVAGVLMQRVHEIASRIRPASLDDLGLEEAVRGHLTEFEQVTGVAVDADLRVEVSEVPHEVAENLYRIVQEALNNVSQHASAHTVRVRLRVTAEGSALEVEDDGVGFDPETVSRERFGLLGIRERAELLGGTFALTSTPGRGTRLDVVL